MKLTNLEIDATLVAAGLKLTGLGSTESLVDYALRELLGREQVRCHCRFAEDPLSRFRWTHPEVADVCRSGQGISKAQVDLQPRMVRWPCRDSPTTST